MNSARSSLCRWQASTFTLLTAGRCLRIVRCVPFSIRHPPIRKATFNYVMFKAVRSSVGSYPYFARIYPDFVRSSRISTRIKMKCLNDSITLIHSESSRSPPSQSRRHLPSWSAVEAESFAASFAVSPVFAAAAAFACAAASVGFSASPYMSRQMFFTSSSTSATSAPCPTSHDVP